MFVDMSMTLK